MCASQNNNAKNAKNCHTQHCNYTPLTTNKKGDFYLQGTSSAVVNAYGYVSAVSANFYVTAPTATFNFYGYNAGTGALVDCGASSICTINCAGNGCSGLTLSCSGTCNVNCDLSLNIYCPNGYVGPTPAPTDSPSPNPTPSPTGGSSEIVPCYDYMECDDLTLTGTSVDCRGYQSCESSIITSSSSHVYCTAENSCYDATINSASNLYCHSETGCGYATVTGLGGNNIFAYGYYSARNLNFEVSTTTTQYIYGYGYVSLYGSTLRNNGGPLTLTGDGKLSFQNSQISSSGALNINGYGWESFYGCNINMTGSTGTNTIQGYNFDTFENANIYLQGTSNNIYLDGVYAGYLGNFVLAGSSTANVYAYGYVSAVSATFTIYSPTATFYFYGYSAGSGATVNCESGSICNIECAGNGCDGVILNCIGTCNVNCDESMNIACPNGLVGPTPSPTDDPTPSPTPGPTDDPTPTPTDPPTSDPTARPSRSPTNNPTASPSGGSGENVVCDGTQQCAGIGSIFGTNVECSGTESCSGIASIASLSGDVTCSGSSSCFGSSISAASGAECIGDRSCAQATISDASTINGYSYRSLAGATIDTTGVSGAVSMNFYGYETLDGASIICASGSTCNIKCVGNACANSTLTCTGTCNVLCDESKDISCPIGIVGPTSSPTNMPSGAPTSRPTSSPTGEPSPSPTPGPTKNPIVPGSPTELPTTGEPTDSPTPMPSGQPTSIPSNDPSTDPTSSPTTDPTRSPSGNPSTTPTGRPSASPSERPTTSPTGDPTVEPSAEPTRNPVASGAVSQDAVFIDRSDIRYDSFGLQANALQEEHLMFNPGFRTVLEASISVNLDTSDLVTLFDDWINGVGDENSNISMSVDWEVVDTTTRRRQRMLLSSDIDSTIYTDTELTTINNGENGTFEINSYFILYSTQSVSKYSQSICNVYDTSFFEPGHEYTIESNVEFVYYYYYEEDDSIQVFRARSSNDVELTANAPATNGSCVVTPEQGTALVDTFTFACSGWVDEDSVTSGGITYNFIYDNSVFLKPDYDEDASINTILGVGEQTIAAIILDEFSLPTCVGLIVNVDSNITELNNPQVDAVTSWMRDMYSNMTSGDDINGAINQLSMLADIFYNLLLDYMFNYDDDLTAEDKQLLAELQTAIVEILIDQATGGINSTLDANSILSVLATITQPLSHWIEWDDNIDDDVYNLTLITKIFNIIQDDIINQFINDILNGTLDQLETNAAGYAIDVFENTIQMEMLGNGSSSDANESILFGQTVVDGLNEISQLLLTSSLPGESYSFETESLSVESTKISTTTFSECGSSSGSVSLSEEYVEQVLLYGNGSNYVDCTVVLSDLNIYDLNGNSLNNSDQVQSNFVLVEVSPELTVESLESGGSGAAAASTLGGDDIFVSECQPIILTFNNTNSTFFGADTTHFPKCSFFNETSQEIESDGCYLIDYDAEYSRCSCLHLTYLFVRTEEFEPEINFYTIDHWREISVPSLLAYPLGWIACFAWILVCVALICVLKWNQQVNKGIRKFDPNDGVCCKSCYKDDKPLIARLDVIDNLALLSQEEKMKYRSIIELKWLKDSSKNENIGLCKQWGGLWCINLRNDHLCCGICCRDWGTSYTHAQRTSILMVRLLTNLAVAAMFFGKRKDSAIGDISLVLYESLLSLIPTYALQKFISKHKPGVRKYRQQKLMNVNSQASIASMGSIGSVPSIPSVDNEPAGFDRVPDASPPQSPAAQALKLKPLNRMSPAEIVAGQQQQQSQIPIEDGTNDHTTKENIRRLVNVAEGKRATTVANAGRNTDDYELGTLPTNKLMMLLRKTSNDEVIEQIVQKPNVLPESAVQVDRMKIGLMQEIQQRLFNETYKLPYCCKYVAIGLIIFWSLLCAIITSIWCLWFEVENIDYVNEYGSEISGANCSDSVYGSIPMKSWLNYNLTANAINDIILNTDPTLLKTVYNPPSGDSFGDSMEVSTRFLIAVVLSYLLSVFLWQPLIIAIKSFITLLRYLKNPDKVNEALLFYEHRTLKTQKFTSVEMGLAGISGAGVGVGGAAGIAALRVSHQKDDDDDLLYESGNNNGVSAGNRVNLQQANSVMSLPDLPRERFSSAQPPMDGGGVDSAAVAVALGQTPGNDNDDIDDAIMDLVNKGLPRRPRTIDRLRTSFALVSNNNNNKGLIPVDDNENGGTEDGQAQEGWVGETANENAGPNDILDDSDDDDDLQEVYEQAFGIDSANGSQQEVAAAVNSAGGGGEALAVVDANDDANVSSGNGDESKGNVNKDVDTNRDDNDNEFME